MYIQFKLFPWPWKHMHSFKGGFVNRKTSYQNRFVRWLLIRSDNKHQECIRMSLLDLETLATIPLVSHPCYGGIVLEAFLTRRYSLSLLFGLNEPTRLRSHHYCNNMDMPPHWSVNGMLVLAEITNTCPIRRDLLISMEFHYGIWRPRTNLR